MVFGLAVGAVSEIAQWRLSVILNPVLYIAIASVAIWNSAVLFGDHHFLAYFVTEAVPLTMLAAINAFLYWRSWRIKAG
jgi:hypothetical protein